MPTNSPCAPAAGVSVTASMPLTSASIASSSTHNASAPCTSGAGHIGWIPAKPGRRAAHSFTIGLYFIVHDPSG